MLPSYNFEQRVPFYNVSCDSVEAEVIWAYADDISKLIKNERKVMKYMSSQFYEKCPNKKITDAYFEQVFSEQFVPAA